MDQRRTDESFYAGISAEARLPERDTRDLVSDFFNAISAFLADDAWRVLVDLVPGEMAVARDNGTKTDGTIEEFLLEMSDAESVETGRAAEHARVVAEALRSRADDSHLEALRDSIENDELLALFELSRGELTEAETPTAGQRAQLRDPPSE
jgi:hypothetical protein